MNAARHQRVCILGSTGSVGVSTLDVIARHPDRFTVVALTAHSRIDDLHAQCLRWRPRFAAVSSPEQGRLLRERLREDSCRTEVLVGAGALCDLAGHPEVDTVMGSIVGAAGLAPCLAAARAGKRLLLANKEALVVGGRLFMQAVREGGGTFVPIDSEHSAIFQCLPEDRSVWAQRIDHIVLTASGGPFRTRDPATLSTVTPDEACAHPNWVMGRKISVDSATMMNKALEVIEAHWLFDLEPAQIRVVIHPQSIVHSMVVCRDNSVLAQLGTPDMRVPIAYGLAFPERIESGASQLDFTAMSQLSFEAPDFSRYPGLQLAWDTLRATPGSTAVLNAANEEAVAAFLAGTIRFDRIHSVNACTLESVQIAADETRCVEEPHRTGRTRAPASRAPREADVDMITLLAFVLTLGVLILVHEYGHYRVAVACGVKVDRFSLGFGRVLWRRQPTPGGTEFVISALPLGGYVRWIDDREEGVLPSEQHQTFKSKSLARRAAIVVAGPLANLLLAVLLYAGANWIGVDEPRAIFGSPPAGSLAEQAGVRAGDLVRAASVDGEDWREVRSLSDLNWALAQAVSRGESLQLQVSDAAGRATRNVALPLDTLESHEIDAATMRRIGLNRSYSEPVIDRVAPSGPADRAGLQAHDRVLSVNGSTVADRAQLLDAIRGSVQGTEAKPMDWRVDRSGRVMDLVVHPSVVKEGDHRIGRIEAYIGRPMPTVLVRYGFVDGLTQAATRTWEMSALTMKMLGKMLIGQASLKNLSGPLTIADYAGQSVKLGLAYYLGFLAVVSVSLGVLNLLPLPVLDGGHLMYYLFEAVTGRPVSEQWLARLQRGGLAFVLLMMSLALYNDLARLLGLH